MLDHVIRLYTIEFWYRLLYQMINSLASSTILQFHISNSLYLINKWIHFSKFLCGMLLLFHCACVPFLSTGPLRDLPGGGLYAAENDQMASMQLKTTRWQNEEPRTAAQGGWRDCLGGLPWPQAKNTYPWPPGQLAPRAQLSQAHPALLQPEYACQERSVVMWPNQVIGLTSSSRNHNDSRIGNDTIKCNAH